MQAMRYSKIATLFLLFTLFSVVAVYAAERSIQLEGSPLAPEARGTAVIKDTEGTVRGEPQKDITISAHGLEPGAVYSVWFLNMKPMMEVAKVSQDNSFKSDNRGIGTFTAAVPASELDRWQSIQVAQQPGGDPANVQPDKFALRGYIR